MNQITLIAQNQLVKSAKPSTRSIGDADNTNKGEEISI